MLEYLLRTISCDYYLHTHSINVVAYSAALAWRAGFSDSATLREIANGALLHDIGKRGVEDTILSKKETLSVSEWEAVK